MPLTANDLISSRNTITQLSDPLKLSSFLKDLSSTRNTLETYFEQYASEILFNSKMVVADVCMIFLYISGARNTSSSPEISTQEFKDSLIDTIIAYDILPKLVKYWPLFIEMTCKADMKTGFTVCTTILNRVICSVTRRAEEKKLHTAFTYGNDCNGVSYENSTVCSGEIIKMIKFMFEFKDYADNGITRILISNCVPTVACASHGTASLPPLGESTIAAGATHPIICRNGKKLQAWMPSKVVTAQSRLNPSVEAAIELEILVKSYRKQIVTCCVYTEVVTQLIMNNDCHGIEDVPSTIWKMLVGSTLSASLSNKSSPSSAYSSSVSERLTLPPQQVLRSLLDLVITCICLGPSSSSNLGSAVNGGESVTLLDQMLAFMKSSLHSPNRATTNDTEFLRILLARQRHVSNTNSTKLSRFSTNISSSGPNRNYLNNYRQFQNLLSGNKNHSNLYDYVCMTQSLMGTAETVSLQLSKCMFRQALLPSAIMGQLCCWLEYYGTNIHNSNFCYLMELYAAELRLEISLPTARPGGQQSPVKRTKDSGRQNSSSSLVHSARLSLESFVRHFEIVHRLNDAKKIKHFIGGNVNKIFQHTQLTFGGNLSSVSEIWLWELQNASREIIDTSFRRDNVELPNLHSLNQSLRCLFWVANLNSSVHNIFDRTVRNCIVASSNEILSFLNQHCILRSADTSIQSKQSQHLHQSSTFDDWMGLSTADCCTPINLRTNVTPQVFIALQYALETAFTVSLIGGELSTEIALNPEDSSSTFSRHQLTMGLLCQARKCRFLIRVAETMNTQCNSMNALMGGDQSNATPLSVKPSEPELNSDAESELRTTRQSIYFYERLLTDIVTQVCMKSLKLEQLSSDLIDFAKSGGAHCLLLEYALELVLALTSKVLAADNTTLSFNWEDIALAQPNKEIFQSTILLEVTLTLLVALPEVLEFAESDVTVRRKSYNVLKSLLRSHPSFSSPQFLESISRPVDRVGALVLVLCTYLVLEQFLISDSTTEKSTTGHYGLLTHLAKALPRNNLGQALDPSLYLFELISSQVVRCQDFNIARCGLRLLEVLSIRNSSLCDRFSNVAWYLSSICLVDSIKFSGNPSNVGFDPVMNILSNTLMCTGVLETCLAQISSSCSQDDHKSINATVSLISATDSTFQIANWNKRTLNQTMSFVWYFWLRWWNAETSTKRIFGTAALLQDIMCIYLQSECTAKSKKCVTTKLPNLSSPIPAKKFRTEDDSSRDVLGSGEVDDEEDEASEYEGRKNSMSKTVVRAHVNSIQQKYVMAEKYSLVSNKKVAPQFIFASMTDNDPYLHYQIAMSMIPALLITCKCHDAEELTQLGELISEALVEALGPYHNYCVSCKLVVHMLQGFNDLMKEGRQLQFCLKSAGFNVRLCKAILQATEIGLANCVSWRNTGSTLKPQANHLWNDSSATVDFYSFEYLCVAMEHSLRLCDSIMTFADCMMTNIISSSGVNLDVPKNLGPTINKLKQLGGDTTARIFRLAEAYFVELKTEEIVDTELFSDFKPYISYFLRNEVRNMAVNSSEPRSNCSHNSGRSNSSEVYTQLNGDTEQKHTSEALSGYISEEYHASERSSFPASPTLISPHRGWGLYRYEH